MPGVGDARRPVDVEAQKVITDPDGMADVKTDPDPQLDA